MRIPLSLLLSALLGLSACASAKERAARKSLEGDGKQTDSIAAVIGYSSLTYILNRFRDLFDTVSITLSFGCVWGAKAYVGPVSVGLHAQEWPLRLGTREFGLLRGSLGAHYIQDRTLIYQAETAEPAAYGSDRRESRLQWRGSSLPYYTRVGAAVGFGIGVRVEVNPGEAADFLLGLFGIDLLQDDLFSAPRLVRMSRLESALRSCDLKAVESELRSGGDSPPLGSGEHPVLLAARCSDIAIAKTVLGSVTGRARREPRAMAKLLRAAALSKRPELVDMLLDHGADPSSPEDVEAAKVPVPPPKGTQYQSLLHMAIEQAVISREPAWVRIATLLVERGADVTVVEPHLGKTTILVAAEGPLPELVGLLYRKGARPLQRSKTYKPQNVLDALLTPPQGNAEDWRIGWERRAATWRALLDAGLPVDTRNADGRTLLMLAAMAMDENPVVPILLSRKADTHARSARGWTALMLAARTERSGNMQRLLRAGARIEERDADGKTALMHSILAPQIKHRSIDFLLKHGADVNAPMKDGWTPIMAATWRRDQFAVKLVLANRPSLDLRNANGETALEIARRQSTPEIVEMLIKAGAR